MQEYAIHKILHHCFSAQYELPGRERGWLGREWPYFSADVFTSQLLRLCGQQIQLPFSVTWSTEIDPRRADMQTWLVTPLPRFETENIDLVEHETNSPRKSGLKLRESARVKQRADKASSSVGVVNVVK